MSEKNSIIENGRPRATMGMIPECAICPESRCRGPFLGDDATIESQRDRTTSTSTSITEVK
jgi:hypothetical protein